VYAKRRQRLLETMGPGAVAVLLGAPLVKRSRDTEFPFRQDSDFWYLTGFNHPNAAMVLRTDGGPTYTLYVEPRDPDAEIWTGYRPGVEGARRDYDADESFPRSEFLKHVPDFLKKAKHVDHVLGRDTAVDARIVDTLDGLRLRSRQGESGADGIADPRAILHEMRLFKDPTELDILRRASEITREAHESAARLARQPVYEYELEALIEYTFRRRGARGPAYTTIVGGGSNATILHYITNDQKLRENELVLVDAGSELEGYATDVTRTYPVGGRFSGPGRAIYEVVLAAQLAALEVCRPGNTLPAIHDVAVRTLVEGLVDLGILSGDVQELIAREAHRRYYMHNTSHWLGLDVHDTGLYRIDDQPRPLAPNMVFTVEPGLYVGKDDEQADPRFRGIGVRIEDDVVITEAGHENLSGSIPKTPDDLEALINES
jgi:Xaa-Pro aminopeptidase